MENEQVTFDGIPIPLTRETLLDVMSTALVREQAPTRTSGRHRFYRQYCAFRERILRVDASAQMSPLWKRVAKKWFDRGEIAEGQVILYEIAITAKDARIAELEEHNTRLEAILDELRKHGDIVYDEDIPNYFDWDDEKYSSSGGNDD